MYYLEILDFEFHVLRKNVLFFHLTLLLRMLTEAPFCSSSRATSKWPQLSASCRGVTPSQYAPPGSFMFAPLSNSKDTIPIKHKHNADKMLTQNVSNPVKKSFKKNLTNQTNFKQRKLKWSKKQTSIAVPKWPWLQASCSGVQPQWSLGFSGWPYYRKN